ncbi:hypothetical protein JHK82_055815 [Glycine max]|nr:hypothetical protein JHK85_056643 [Glycine max]KAG5077120.1 hypothetical protein JHK82_055815 [Glycine max]
MAAETATTRRTKTPPSPKAFEHVSLCGVVCGIHPHIFSFQFAFAFAFHLAFCFLQEASFGHRWPRSMKLLPETPRTARRSSKPSVLSATPSTKVSTTNKWTNLAEDGQRRATPGTQRNAISNWGTRGAMNMEAKQTENNMPMPQESMAQGRDFLIASQSYFANSIELSPSASLSRYFFYNSQCSPSTLLSLNQFCFLSSPSFQCISVQLHAKSSSLFVTPITPIGLSAQPRAIDIDASADDDYVAYIPAALGAWDPWPTQD